MILIDSKFTSSLLPKIFRHNITICATVFSVNEVLYVQLSATCVGHFQYGLKPFSCYV